MSVAGNENPATHDLMLDAEAHDREDAMPEGVAGGPGARVLGESALENIAGKFPQALGSISSRHENEDAPNCPCHYGEQSNDRAKAVQPAKISSRSCKNQSRHQPP